MFLVSLTISDDDLVIRHIPFFKGINLVVDETKTQDKTESGNSVGKTTVLRLIDFCLGGDGKNIYVDPEFKNSRNREVEAFLKDNNIIITLTLADTLPSAGDDATTEGQLEIRRNFLSRDRKIQEINREQVSDPQAFYKRLKELIFDSSDDKPTFRQIISKNIRDEKNRLVNTIKVLHTTTTYEVYESVFLFWLGIDVDDQSRKMKLMSEKKLEVNLQKRLKKESNLSQIDQSLIILHREINTLEARKAVFNLNEKYSAELERIGEVQAELNRLSTELSRLELRRDLIEESRQDLEEDLANIDTRQIRRIYEEAGRLIGTIQKSFEDAVNFHNEMVAEKVKYITAELPKLRGQIRTVEGSITKLRSEEKALAQKLSKLISAAEYEVVMKELNHNYEQRGRIQEKKRLWEHSIERIEKIDEQLAQINEGIVSKDDKIQARIAEFNKYFAEISQKLYGEKFVLSSELSDRGYSLNITSIDGNVGTGKKKGEMASFDLAYIQFADSIGLPCLHFILQDQIENVHDNQIDLLLTNIVGEVNCQYVLPVLRDKLPPEIDAEKYTVLSLSQDEKLFRV